VPTEESRGIIRRLVTVMGATHHQVAAVMDLSRTTVRKHYKRELAQAQLKTHIAVGQTLVCKALGGSVDNPNWERADADLLRFYLARRVPGWQRPTQAGSL
jgi:hypothetical protein